MLIPSFFYPSAEHFLVSSNFQKDMTLGFDSAKISWNVTSATFHIPADARTRDQVGFVLFLPESHRSSARKEVNIEQRASVGSERKLTLQFECRATKSTIDGWKCKELYREVKKGW